MLPAEGKALDAIFMTGAEIEGSALDEKKGKALAAASFMRDKPSPYNVGTAKKGLGMA